MLTVQSTARRAGARAGRRQGGGRGADPLGAHQRAARPDAVDVRRRAAAHDRDPAHRAPTSSARSCGGSSTTTSPASASAPASSTTTIPPAIVEEAERLGFPLFEVPYEMPFIAITEKAFARLVNEQYEVLQRGIAVHRRLEQLVLEERGLRGGRARALGRDRRRDRDARPARRARWRRANFRRELPAAALEAIRAEVERAQRQRARRDPFEPAHDDVAGRALALPVARRAAAGRGPGSSRSATPAASASSSG